ncbi:MAG: hypothetical protein CMD83_03460 [Gammaproteobacteria bacterium]|nr:hypothetical protein [Gammaproteobacteria bacterium]
MQNARTVVNQLDPAGPVIEHITLIHLRQNSVGAFEGGQQRTIAKHRYPQKCTRTRRIGDVVGAAAEDGCDG